MPFFFFKPVFNFRIPHLIFCLEGICQNRREKKKKRKKYLCPNSPNKAENTIGVPWESC